MSRKKGSTRFFHIPLLIILMCMLLLSQPMVLAQDDAGGIRIQVDGTVSPEDAPVSREGNVYTLKGKIRQPMFIEKDDVVVDGHGFMTMTPADCPAWEQHGVTLHGRRNVTIKNLVIRSYWLGINIDNSSDITVYNVTLTRNYHAIKLTDSHHNHITACNLSANYHDGIQLYSSHHNTISKNRITTPELAIKLENSEDNTITQNHLYNSEDGLVLIESPHNHIQYNNFSHHQEGIWIFQSNNTIQHNNFINNDQQATAIQSQCTWSQNYWSNHQPPEPYTINEENADPDPKETPNIIPEFTTETIILLPLITLLLVLLTKKLTKQNL